MGGIQWRSERWLHHEGGAGGAQDGHQWQGALVWWRWVMVCHVIVHLFSPSRQLHPGPDQPLGAGLQHGQLAASVLGQEAEVTGFIYYLIST